MLGAEDGDHQKITQVLECFIFSFKTTTNMTKKEIFFRDEVASCEIVENAPLEIA